MADERSPREFGLGDWWVRPSSNSLEGPGGSVRLQSKVMDVLVCLAERPGETVSKEELLQRVWADTAVVESVLTNAIFELRRALGDTARESRYVETVPRRGYQLVAAVTAEPPGWCRPQAARTARRRVPARVAAGLGAVLVLAAAVWLVRASTGTDEPIESLAVLPLQNLTGDPAQEYLADGLTDALITDLARVSGLRVISRTSAMTYKEAARSLPAIAEELGVDGVLEGALLHSGDRVRITAQLIDARSDTHLWAQSYEYPLGSLLELPREVAAEVTRELGAPPEPEPSRAARAPGAPRPEAVDSYFRAVYELAKPSGEVERAVELLEGTLAADPNFALAYAQLAGVYVAAAWTNELPPHEAFPRARELARRALAIDPRIPEAHLAQASITEIYDWDWKAAEEHYRRALDLAPNHALTRGLYAEFLAARGRFEEALVEAGRSAQLDPLNMAPKIGQAWILFLARRYDDALREYDEIRARLRERPLREHAVTLCEAGRHDEAIRLLTAIEQQRPEDFHTIALLSQARARSGDRAGARADLERLLELAERGGVQPTAVAKVLGALGERDEAFAWLERAYAERSSSLVLLEVNPQFDSLRSDPRFDDLVRRIGPAPEAPPEATLPSDAGPEAG